MKCFIPGCKSGTRHNDEKNARSFFSAPRNEQLLEIWQDAIAGKKILKPVVHKICDLHFLPSDISWNFEQNMPDGTSFTLRRCKPKLNVNAVPSIFPKRPKSPLPYAHVFDIKKFIEKDTDTVEKRSTIAGEELPTEIVSERSSGLPPTVVSAPLSELASESSSKPTCEPLSEHFSELSSKHASAKIYMKLSPRAVRRAEEEKANEEAALKRQFMKICEELDRDPQSLLLHKTWSTQIINKKHLQCLIWILWKDDASRMLKRIVLHSDMRVEIFLDEKRVIIPEMQEVETVADMTYVVSQFSEKIIPCCKADGKKSAPQCPGYLWLNENNLPEDGRLKKRCPYCLKLRISTLRKMAQEQKATRPR